MLEMVLVFLLNGVQVTHSVTCYVERDCTTKMNSFWVRMKDQARKNDAKLKYVSSSLQRVNNVK